MVWKAHIAEGLKPVVDLVYPPRCPCCGDVIATQGGLCVDCWSELDAPGEPACESCQRPLGHGTVGKPGGCRACRERLPRHSGIMAATLYNDASRKLVLSFKHGGKISLAPLLGRLMAARIPDPEGLPPVIVPVPLHRLRLWQRGFNQSAFLAQELARAGKGDLMVDALIRRKSTPSLGGLGSEERRKVLEGAIVVRGRIADRIAGREVVLVDDVLTSGATSNACVAALLAAKACSVRIACFARAM